MVVTDLESCSMCMGFLTTIVYKCLANFISEKCSQNRIVLDAVKNAAIFRRIL